MKKLSFLLATLSLAVVGFAGGGTALATEPCSITDTGPGSTNLCKSTTTDKCEVTNDNNVNVDNNNQQNAGSGTATNSGNTSGGSAASGSASNDNSTSVTGTITNGDTCSATVTPVTPGKGSTGGAGATVSTEQATPVTPVTPAQTAAPGMGEVMPAALPNTNALSPLATTAAVATVAGIALTIARFVLRSYFE